MVPIITNFQVSEIADPKLRKVLGRVVHEMKLTIEKVAAHHAKPNEFPLPSDPNSTEHILATRFMVLPQGFKDRAGAKALERINVPATAHQRQRDDLFAVNLKASVAIGAQVRALPMPAALKFTPDELAILIGPILVTTTPPRLTRLELRLHKVRCVDETGGWFGERSGNDEIDLGGTAVDETGDTHVITKFRVGSDFNDGKEVVYSPPQQFTLFNLTEGAQYPKSYFVTLVLAEADMGGLSEFLNKLLEKVREKVTAALIAAFGGMIGASGGPVGFIIGVAVGYVVGEVFKLFKSVWADEIFQPVTVGVNITSLNAQWPGSRTDSPEGVATFVGHDGIYEVTYDWRMFSTLLDQVSPVPPVVLR